MAELEPGHPDELVKTLRNWIREAQDPIGSLPDGMDSVEWAIRRFIASWAKPVRDGIDEIQGCLSDASEALETGNVAAARRSIDAARQILGESVRDELGLYDWNKD
jgi:hypothetical protein